MREWHERHQARLAVRRRPTVIPLTSRTGDSALRRRALKYHPGHTNRPWTEPDNWKLPSPDHLPRLTTSNLERARDLRNRQEEVVGCLRRTHRESCLWNSIVALHADLVPCLLGDGIHGALGPRQCELRLRRCSSHHPEISMTRVRSRGAYSFRLGFVWEVEFELLSVMSVFRDAAYAAPPERKAAPAPG